VAAEGLWTLCLNLQINRVVKDPPSYITKAIGPRPASGNK
jgi:hypothetical protein